MKVNKLISAVASTVLGLIIVSFTAAVAEEPKQDESRAFSSADVDPAVIDSGLEPEINIQQFDNREVQEYSVNDRVYMVKITPAAGFPYYLVDPDGTGEMEYKRDTMGLEVNPPQWTLFRW
ncbi:MAG: DUF2782 domain-containing protein [Arenicellales bacterium]|jgi:hypothetical protein